MLLDLCVPSRRFEHIHLKIKSGSSSQFISHHPDSRLKDTFHEVPQHSLLCVEDIRKIFVIETIERSCFKDAQAVVVSCIFEGYFWSKHHCAYYCTRFGDGQRLAEDFLLVGRTSIFGGVPRIHFIFLDGGSSTLCQLEPMLVCPRLLQGASAIRLVIRIESYHGMLDGSARTP